MTMDVLGDLMRENLAKVYVVDNKGDLKLESDNRIQVIRTCSNLGWLGGTNLGLMEASNHRHIIYLCLNNDVRLSRNFLKGLLNFYLDDYSGKVGIFSPVYRGSHACMYPENGYRGDAQLYLPKESHREVPYLDGTALCIPHEVFAKVGYLDDAFKPSNGWGADLDYAMRVKRAGLSCWVTESAYAYHIGAVTAQKVLDGYFEVSAREQYRIFTEKYGESVMAELVSLTPERNSKKSD